MRALVLGAGRGSRLNALTEDQPKPYAPIGEHRILDYLLAALTEAGVGEIVFIGGYRMDLVQRDYPHLTFRHNPEWAETNILASLMSAEDCMEEGFVVTYADILYRSDVVRRAIDHPGDRVLCVDTDWRSRYAERSQHPEEDAEKVIAEGDRILRVNRTLDADTAHGEYIGVARFSRAGAQSLRDAYHDARLSGKAYLIHLYEDMLEAGLTFHMVTTDGQYMEIDTEKDFAQANRFWPRRYGAP